MSETKEVFFCYIKIYKIYHVVIICSPYIVLCVMITVYTIQVLHETQRVYLTVETQKKQLETARADIEQVKV